MSTTQSGKLVVVFGASGFVGRHVVRALAQKGYRVRAAVRRPDLAEHLQPLGNPGQIMPVQANLRNPQSIAAALKGADIAINLVGILFETGKQSFAAVQAEGPKAVAEAAKTAGVGQFIHVSAIGADADSAAEYGRTKAAGEQAVLATLPESIILRPSIIFGPEDDFFNRFGRMAMVSPALPLIGGGHTKLQPVFVGDVAAAVMAAVEGRAKPGTTYELGGPQVRTFRQCLELLCRQIKRKRLLVTIPFGIARLKARVLQILPNPLLTVDQINLLKQDNVVSEAAKTEGRTLADLGIAPHSLEAILPSYLEQYMPHGQFDVRRPDQVDAE
ncbi:complex I NDUFA9 subunit family protein [Polycladidibacter hongkongensis]|uniref:complex I NDUFA9 subunit family protein n=1 Tax=Polycladidibacter hongkongensis TaxID=1647556 RepID=UPI000829943C|nr:complex I NDUFA9 subunit family protein [Pseudovibrio hongkongensis]